MADNNSSDYNEVSLLQEFLGTRISLSDEIGYAVESLFSSVWYIAISNNNSLCGRSIEDQSEIRQWIEYYCTKLRGISVWQPLPREQLQTILKKIDSHMSTRLHFCGCGFTLADVLFYYGLHKYMIDMNYSDKQKYINVTRWFDYVQHIPSIKPFTWSTVQCPKSNK